MSIQSLIDTFNSDIDAAIKALPFLRADKLGLDRRAGAVYVDAGNRAIYCPVGNLRAFDYYGGMEYVKDGDGRQSLPGYVRFDGYESDRVAECFDALAEGDDADESGDE